MIVLSRCVGVQAKNEQVPQGTNSGIFWAKYRKINYFAHNLSLNQGGVISSDTDRVPGGGIVFSIFKSRYCI